MIKKRLLLILTPLLLFACKEDESLIFNEEPGVYFSRNNIELEYDFAFGKEFVEDEWGYKMPIWLGDSLLNDTVKLEIYRSGKLIEGVNSFNLKQIKIDFEDGEEVYEPFEIEFFNPYTFDVVSEEDDEDAEKVDKDKVTVKVVFHRPNSRGVFKTAIGFELSESGGGFVNTVNEFSKITITAKDQYPRPTGWIDESSIYGTYSEEKYAFYVTVLGKIYESWHEYMGDDYLPKLRAALEEYNATHDVPKDFTF